jgi:hypothetical protein
MRKNVLLFILLIPLNLFGQRNLTEYTASNGITYTISDTVKLGRGSAPNGDFLFLQMGGWLEILGYDATEDADQFNIGRQYNGIGVVIKKIQRQRIKGQDKIYFVVGAGNITNFKLMIEDAIASCEIADCIKEPEPPLIGDDKFEKLKKLKELLDLEILTQEEFEVEKKKILEGDQN